MCNLLFATKAPTFRELLLLYQAVVPFLYSDSRSSPTVEHVVPARVLRECPGANPRALRDPYNLFLAAKRVNTARADYPFLLLTQEKLSTLRATPSFVRDFRKIGKDSYVSHRHRLFIPRYKDYGIVSRSVLHCSKTYGVDCASVVVGGEDVVKHWSKHRINHVLCFQLNIMVECRFFSEMPNDPSWHKLAHEMREKNMFSSPSRSSLDASDGIDEHAECTVVDELQQKYKAVAASATLLRQETACTVAGAKNFIGTLLLWQAWYVSETIYSFARYKGNTAYCLDWEFGSGEYMWSIFSMASKNDLDRFVKMEPVINTTMKRLQDGLEPMTSSAFARHTGCNGVRIEVCTQYLKNVVLNRIKRIPMLEDALTSLPCHHADSGGMVWVEGACLSRWKKMLGIPLFFSCDARACCTTLCEESLRVFINSTSPTGARNLLRMPIQHTCDCPVSSSIVLAVLMATHPRLGEDSPLAMLDMDIIDAIITLYGGVHEGSGIHMLETAASRQPPTGTRNRSRGGLKSLLWFLSFFNPRTDQ